VQGVLAARIDRLQAQEKDLLQTLAVIGKEFSLGLIRKVAEQSEDDLYQGISRLQAAEFIYEQPAFPEPEYTFKHALTQEVAYQSLLGERRGVLHERTAHAIEELYSDALDAHYGELAHHYGRTRNIPKALEYLRLSGEQAMERAAYAEATSQLSRGVELVSTLPESRERAQQELLLQLALGEALTSTRGQGALETEQAYVRARDLCEQVGDTLQLFRTLGGLHWIHLSRGEFEKANEQAEQLLQLARSTKDSVHLLAGHHAVGATSFWRGEFGRAREHIEEGIRLYDPEEIRSRGYLWTAYDPGVYLRASLSWVLMALGYPDQALRWSREALSLARELSHPVGEAFALAWGNMTRLNRGEWQAALEGADALIALANEHGFPDWLAGGMFQRGSSLAEQGQLQEGIATMRSIVDAGRATGGTAAAQPAMIAELAEAHAKGGAVEEGLALVREAQGLVTKTGERVREAKLHRVKGELLLTRSPPDEAEAEASFHASLDVARRQGSKSYELQAATSLARLWQQQGRKDEARELLAPVYDWFTEGFDTRDLKEARALLEELA
jgi:predicted ATPase